MGDSDNNSQPSKKRAAGVQLTRDNPGLDDNEESRELEAGTFKRASDEVLATRRIVKVRRQQPSSAPAAPDPSPASNPFAAIRLVPTTSSAPPVPAEAHIIKSNVAEQTTDSKPENKETDDCKLGNKECDTSKPENEVVGTKGESEPTTEEGKNDGNENSAGQSESKTDDAEAQPDAPGDESNDVSKRDAGKSVVDEVKEDGNPDDGVKNPTAAEKSEIESKKDVEDDGNDQEKEKVEAAGEKNAGTTSFGLFQHLSNSQNAFSGFSGTGFSSASFSFGSANRDESAAGSGTGSVFGLNGDRPTFSFGASNNGGSSIFGGTSVANVKDNEGSGFPPREEVSVETGEENEQSVFNADSILFEFIDGSWKERGKGEIKVNVPTMGTGKARLVMRARGNYRLILNSSLFPDMKLTNMEKKGITFACVNSAAEGKEGLSTVALKFKDASIVENFRATVTEHKSQIPAAAVKTPENSPKTDEAP